MRACPQVGLSPAMDKISPRRSLGILGLPIRRDFKRQNSLKPFRCHPTRVSGRTVIKASLQSNSFATNIIVTELHRWPGEVALGAPGRGSAVIAERGSQR